MSLRIRIPLLFIGFAILPVLLLGLGDYLQSVQALQAVIDARREALAVQTAREVERSYARAQESLHSIGAAAVLDSPDASSQTGSAWPVPFDSIRTLGSAGTTGVLVPDRIRDGKEQCEVGSASMLIRVAQPADSEIRFVEGFLRAASFAALAPSLSSRLGQDGYTRILDHTGEILFDSNCLRADAESVVPEPEAAGFSAPSVEASGGESAIWRESVSTVGQPDWQIAVYTNDQEFLAPFQRSRLLYVIVAILVLIAATGIFSILAQGSLGSLRALIRAADEVHLGNMKPWLPPPGDDDIGRLALAFRKMTDRLDESIRQSRLNQKLAAVGEMASYLSHEIRNPLSSIRLGLQTLHRDLSAGFIPPDADRIIGISLNEVKRLDGVVRTVLEVGRDRGAVDDDTVCDVHGTIEAAVDVIAPKARSKGVEIELLLQADQPLVIGDAEALRGVWLNLIVNALDALEDRDNAKIVVTARSEGDREVQIRVADNGPGVPPYAVDSIFEPFFTTKTEGNGIGLATASATLRAVGGSIAYDEQASVHGAVFLIRLRVAQADPSRETDSIEDVESTLPAVGAA